MRDVLRADIDGDAVLDALKESFGYTEGEWARLLKAVSRLDAALDSDAEHDDAQCF